MIDYFNNSTNSSIWVAVGFRGRNVSVDLNYIKGFNFRVEISKLEHIQQNTKILLEAK